MTQNPDVEGLNFVFMTGGERLDAQALVLAASLRRHHPEATILGYRPPEDPAPGRPLAALFEAIDAEFRPLPPLEQDWAAAYPHGNKIRALAAPREGTISIFLDTDMAMTAPLQESDLPATGEVSVVPEGILSWGKDMTRWERVYRHFDLEVPEERVRLMRGARRLSPPYFNAGFVGIREEEHYDQGRGFGTLWLETAQEIDHRVRVGGKRPWLDQISLPVTMRRFGVSSRIVEEWCNFSISNGRKLPDPFSPRILHYHRAQFLRDWSGAEALIENTLNDIPETVRIEAEAILTQSGYLGPQENEI